MEKLKRREQELAELLKEEDEEDEDNDSDSDWVKKVSEMLKKEVMVKIKINHFLCFWIQFFIPILFHFHLL